MRRSHRILLLLPLIVAACEQRRTPNEFRIPSDYTGWVVVVYEQDTYPPLPEVSGHLVHQIPPSGILVTSSSPQSGWAQDRFLSISGRDGSDTSTPSPQVHSQVMASETGAGTKLDYSYFFVGSSAQFAGSEPVDSKLQEAKELLGLTEG